MNKDLFLCVYKHKYINIVINNEIRYIHNTLHKYSKRFNWERLTKSVVALLQYGYFDLIKSLPQSYYHNQNFQDCAELAASFGHFDILKYIINIIENSKPFISSWYSIDNIFQSALRGGNIEIIEYIYSMVKKYNSYINGKYIVYAAESGRIEVCEWYAHHYKTFNMHKNPGISRDFFYNAVNCGHLNVVKWGLKFFIDYKADLNDKQIWLNAIQSKSIALLDFMFDQEQFKIPFNVKKCVIDAILGANIEVTEWVLSKDGDVGTFDHKEVFQALLNNGSVEMIEYFSDKFGYKIGNPYKNKAEWFYDMCESYLGINQIDSIYRNIKDSLIIWWYENITNFQLPYNPLDHCSMYSLDLIRWFTENNRPEKIGPNTLCIFYYYIDYNYNGGDIVKYSIIDHIIRYRTEQFAHIDHMMDLVLFYSESMELADLIMMKYKQVTCSQSALARAVSNNKLEVVKWIHNNTTIRCDYAIEPAYFLKDSTMIEWLYQNRTESCNPLNIKERFEECSKSVQSFIIHNKPEMIPTNVLEYVHDFSDCKFIIDNYPTYIHRTKSLIDVCASGNVEIVKYLHEYNKKYGIESKTNHLYMSSFKKSLELAIKNQFIDIVKYFFENGPDIAIPPGAKNPIDLGKNHPMNLACKYGRLNICKYLQEHTPYKLEPKHFETAVESGNLELVQWIYENHQYRCSNSALKSAAMNHHFEIVRYLLDKEKKSMITADMFRNAIKSSNLEFVKICLEYGYAYGFNIMKFAGECRSNEITKYLQDIGYKYEQPEYKRKINEIENDEKREGDLSENTITNKKNKI